MAYFTGVAEISLRGDLYLEGQLVGTGRGNAGGAPITPAASGHQRAGSGGGNVGGQGGESADIGGGSGGAAGGGGGGGHGGGGGAGGHGSSGGTVGTWLNGAGGGAWNSPGGWPLYAGSGGGAGGSNNNTEGGAGDVSGGAGGAGGASLTIRCQRIIGSGQIITDGAGGANAVPGGNGPGGQGAGAGGAGAGGHVRIECNHMQTGVQVYARGGQGGATYRRGRAQSRRPRWGRGRGPHLRLLLHQQRVHLGQRQRRGGRLQQRRERQLARRGGGRGQRAVHQRAVRDHRHGQRRRRRGRGSRFS